MKKSDKYRCPTCGVSMHPAQAKILSYMQTHQVLDWQQFTLRSFARKLGIEEHPQKVKHHLLQLEKTGNIVYDRYLGKITLRENTDK